MSQLGNQICCTISTRKSSSCLRWCQRSSKNCSQLGTGMLLRRFYMHIVLFPSYCPYRICNVCIGLLQILPNFKLSHYHHGCVFCSSPFRCSERHEQTRVAQQYIYIYIYRYTKDQISTLAVHFHLSGISEVVSQWTQGYVRQADAFSAMGEVRPALSALSTALRLDPSLRRSKGFQVLKSSLWEFKAIRHPLHKGG